MGVTYFGDGAASEGDFAVALNFAATLKAQTLFLGGSQFKGRDRTEPSQLFLLHRFGSFVKALVH